MGENWAIFIVGAAWTLIMAIMGALFVRELKGIDKNQQELGKRLEVLATKHDTLSNDFYELRGEHYVNHDRRRKL